MITRGTHHVKTSPVLLAIVAALALNSAWAQTLSSLAIDVNQLKIDVANINITLMQLINQIGTLQTSVTSLQNLASCFTCADYNAVKTKANDWAATKPSLATQAALNTQITRITNLETAVDSLSSSIIPALTNRVSALEAKVTCFTCAAFNQHTTDIAAINLLLPSKASTVDLDNLDTRVDALEAQIPNLALSSTVSAINTRLTAVESCFSCAAFLQHTTDISNLQAKVTTISTVQTKDVASMWVNVSTSEAYTDITYNTATFPTRPHMFPVLRARSGAANDTNLAHNMAINQLIEITNGYRIFIYRINTGIATAIATSANAADGAYLEYTLLPA